MPLMEKGVQVITGRMPKVISPKAHAIIDYAMVGTFFLFGALMWRKHKRAAISSLICGGSELGVSLTTDYPGGIWPLISFPTHGKIDAGFAGMVGSMPNLMAFTDEKQSWFFRIRGIALAAVTGLTDFEGVGRQARRPRYRGAA